MQNKKSPLADFMTLRLISINLHIREIERLEQQQVEVESIRRKVSIAKSRFEKK